MPGFNGTGPKGMGPMTGGGKGFCIVTAPADKGTFSGFRRMGCGFGGRGRGHRNWFHATGLPGWMRTAVGTDDSQESVETLKAQATMLENEIKLVNDRIKSLENKESR